MDLISDAPAGAQDTQSTSVDASSIDTGVQSTNSSELIFPEEFYVEGQPDLTKLSQSYKELSEKVSKFQSVSDINEYEFNFESPDSWDQDSFTEFKALAKDLGLSKDQFSGAMKLYEQNVSQMLEKLAPSASTAQSILSKEWGNQFDANIKSASLAFHKFGQGIDKSELGNNPVMYKLLANIGKHLSEDSLSSTVQSSPSTGYTKLQIQEMQQRPDYWTNPEVQRVVSDWYNKTYKD